MRFYITERDGEEQRVQAWILENGEVRELPHVPVHSPDGFEMGYAGSGPADLALAILCDHLHVGDHDPVPGGTPAIVKDGATEAAREAWKWHQPLKAHVVEATRDSLVVTSRFLDVWLERQRKGKG